MNQEIKQEWVRRLRSGEYRQGRKNLHTSLGGYCCLGVLCDMAYEAGVVDRLNYNSDIYAYFAKDDEWDSSSQMLPYAVRKWAGIETGNPDVKIDRAMIPDTDLGLALEGQDLACLNDAGYSFSQIADVIEEQL